MSVNLNNIVCLGIALKKAGYNHLPVLCLNYAKSGGQVKTASAAQAVAMRHLLKLAEIDDVVSARTIPDNPNSGLSAVNSGSNWFAPNIKHYNNPWENDTFLNGGNAGSDADDARLMPQYRTLTPEDARLKQQYRAFQAAQQQLANRSKEYNGYWTRDPQVEKEISVQRQNVERLAQQFQKAYDARNSGGTTPPANSTVDPGVRRSFEAALQDGVSGSHSPASPYLPQPASSTTAPAVGGVGAKPVTTETVNLWNQLAGSRVNDYERMLSMRDKFSPELREKTDKFVNNRGESNKQINDILAGANADGKSMSGDGISRMTLAGMDGRIGEAARRALGLQHTNTPSPQPAQTTPAPQQLPSLPGMAQNTPKPLQGPQPLRR